MGVAREARAKPKLRSRMAQRSVWKLSTPRLAHALLPQGRVAVAGVLLAPEDERPLHLGRVERGSGHLGVLQLAPVGVDVGAQPLPGHGAHGVAQLDVLPIAGALAQDLVVAGQVVPGLDVRRTGVQPRLPRRRLLTQIISAFT